jgi:hypothetical protein
MNTIPTLSLKTSQHVSREYIKLILNSLSLVSALAWNTAFQYLFDSMEFTVWGPWIYAASISLLTIIAIQLSRGFCSIENE